MSDSTSPETGATPSSAAPVDRMPSQSALLVGALVPLSAPGWVEAGQQLLAGLDLAVADMNRAGGLAGRPLELSVKDTAADPATAVAAVDDFAATGAVCVVGEYHSVVARAAARHAETIGLPFLCSSAVLDDLADPGASQVARIAPPQSRGWRVYAEYLLADGHRRVAVVAAPSVYWTAGTGILREHLSSAGGTVVEIAAKAPSAVCDQLDRCDATAALLLVGHPDPVVPLVRAIRRDPRLTELVLGAPAGQPELADWLTLLGRDGCEVPFLRYRLDTLTELGAAAEAALHERLGRQPSFIALEAYDAMLVLADAIASHGADRRRMAEAFSSVAVDGTRGPIRFSRAPGIPVWQWTGAPIQVVERNPTHPERIRVLHTAGS